MARDLPLGNGRFVVDFDLDYNLSDVYYNHAGQANHATGAVSAFGAWTADAGLSWLGKDWQIERRYRPQALVTDVQATQPALRLRLEIADAMPAEPDVLLRQLTVHNLAPAEREVHLFWHLDLEIVGQPFATTALYDPDLRSLLIYKDRTWFLLSGYSEDEPLGLAQFTVGNKGSESDAADGWLDGVSVATGDVDVVGAINCRVPGQGTHVVYFWLLVAPSSEEAIAAHRLVSARTPPRLIAEVAEHGRRWLAERLVDYQRLPPPLAGLYETSLLVILTQQDRSGAIIASPDSTVERPSRDTYQYAWPRDGALVAHALDVAGHADESHKFYRFCAEALSGSFPWLWQKYNLDGSQGSTWHAMFSPGMRVPQLQTQEDETALVIWGLSEHSRYCPGDCVARLYTNWARNLADWLATYRRPDGLPRPSFNLWEESYGIWTFTAAATVAALKGAAAMARDFGTAEEAERYDASALAMRQGIERVLYDERLGRFIAGLSVDAEGEHRVEQVDSSLYGLWAFGALAPDDPRVARTMEAIERELWVPTPVGGVARYPGDRYYRRDPALHGNPWLISTLWLAQWHIALGHTARALELLHWAAERALPSGILAEQVDPHQGAPVSVAPLTWSHSTYALAVHQYLDATRSRQVT
ncbi:MAG TPA: glycoside hydrolase family 15 protein [Anaerolineae bacterium]|nr:glycoside hydrolase family 15 protein [Anaerolineae bacterium]HPL28438.1 glycoside hydrolase family 15 protein [Anaerolineae bacterium]